MILRYMRKKDWVTAAACAFFIILQVYLDLRIPEYMSDITSAIGLSESSSVVYRYGGEMILCAILSFIVSLCASSLAAYTAASLCMSLRQDIFDNVSRFSPEDVHKFTVDSLITRCSNDISQVQNFVAQALQVIVKTPILSVWAIVKISGAEWQWTAATAIGIVVLAVTITALVLSTRSRYKLIPKITDKINHYAMEHLAGIRVVRAYNAERFQEEKFAESSIEMMDNSIYIWKRSSFFPALSSGTSNFLTLAIYWTGITLIASSTGSPHNLRLFSDMIVFTSYVIQVINAFMQLSFLIQFSARSLASSKRVQETISYKPIIIDGEYEGDGDNNGVVEFDHVDFTYPGADSKALEDVSFKVSKGQTLAILGATGSGKSTVVNLLLRSYLPSSGSVRVDGVDVREYKHEKLYSKIGYVPQVNTVFAGPISHNVNYGSTSAYRNADDIRRAIDIAQAAEFVDDMPERENFHVTEGGSNLSGGQRQRIAIARAVCKDAEICIFDDPFSALDFVTDKRLRKALGEARPDATKILVTQRVGTVVDADLIVVLDEGRVVGIGKHDELLRSCPLYHEIAASQMVEGAI